jgi:hypothetical protein
MHETLLWSEPGLWDSGGHLFKVPYEEFRTSRVIAPERIFAYFPVILHDLLNLSCRIAGDLTYAAVKAQRLRLGRSRRWRGLGFITSRNR